MPSAYHFLQRTVGHQELLTGETRKRVERRLADALAGIGLRRLRIAVHPSHVHIFFELPESLSMFQFLVAAKTALAQAAAVPWDEEHYLLPIEEFADDVIAGILADAHAKPARRGA